MNWHQLQTSIGKIAKIRIDDVTIRVVLKNVNQIENGEKWISFVFLDHFEYSPKLYDIHLNNANALFEPIEKRAFRGWYSKPIFDSIELESNPQTG